MKNIEILEINEIGDYEGCRNINIFIFESYSFHHLISNRETRSMKPIYP